MIRFALGTIASLGIFAFAFFLEGGSIWTFILPSVLMIVILLPLFAVFAVWSAKELSAAWQAAFMKAPTEEGEKDAAALWDFYEKVCYVAGIVGPLAGFIIIFRTPNYEIKVFSIALSSLVEGILLGLVARILKARVEKNARARRSS